MYPVVQTKFGRPEGNCFAACVASIFEVTMEDVAHLDRLHVDAARLHDAGQGDTFAEWWDALIVFARRSYGKHPIHLPLADLAPAGYAIASGPGPREMPHSIVIHDGEFAWDPHRSQQGLLEFESFTAFVPLIAPGKTTP